MEIMEDFNGVDRMESEAKVVGKYGLGSRNNRINMLIYLSRT